MNPETTDRVSQSTNPEAYIIARGSLTVSGFSAVTGGYSATGTEIITDILQNALNPSIEVWHYVNQGSGINEWRVCSYTKTTGTAIIRNCNWYIDNVIVSASVEQTRININYFSSTNLVGERDSAYYTQRFYYVVKSHAIAV